MVDHDAVGGNVFVLRAVHTLKVFVDSEEAGLVIPMVRPHRLHCLVRVGNGLHRGKTNTSGTESNLTGNADQDINVFLVSDQQFAEQQLFCR